MNGRWIAASLAVLALAGCHKKEAAKPTPETKPPAPTTAPATGTTAPPVAPQATPPVVAEPPPPEPETAPPAEPPVQPPPATSDRPPYRPVRPRPPIRLPPPKADEAPPIASTGDGRPPAVRIPVQPVKPPIRIGQATPAPSDQGGRPPPIGGVRPKVVIAKKTDAQRKAEADLLGAWRQQNKTAMLRFTPGGWVSLERGNEVLNGKWTSSADGAIHFSLPVPGGDAQLTAHPADSPATGRYLSVQPQMDGPQIWPGYGGLIFVPE